MSDFSSSRNKGGGFSPAPGGAFLVKDEKALLPALQALAHDVRQPGPDTEVTLVEFARSDLQAAIRQFDDLRHHAYIVHLNAPSRLRADRIRRRALPPESAIGDQTITLHLSDDHLLPRGAERSLYQRDNLTQMLTERKWKDRIVEIQNDRDDGGSQMAAGIRVLVDRVVDQYMPERKRQRVAGGVR